MLTSLVERVERVFVVGTPLSRVSNEEWRAAYKVLSLDPVHL
jgi:RPA family protein